MRRTVLALTSLLSLACGGAATTTTMPATTPIARADDPAWMEAIHERVARAESDARTYAHVESLTDAAGPRLAGSEGDRLAVAWGVRYLTELGFANVHAEPVTVRAWVRGEERVEMLAPVPQRLVAAALGGSVGTPEGGIDAEVVRVASLDALAAAPAEQVNGRIVFVDQRMERAHDGSGYGTAVVVRITAASAAAARGAVAVLIRSVGTDSTRFAHTGMMRYAEGAPQIPAAALANPDADMLARTLATGQTVRVHLALGCHDGGEAQSANVIGEVVGDTHPEEIVLLGAHLDSWDLGRGAIDDGAGVGIVVEAARQILTSETRPHRTVRVVLFANEENGSAGAMGYAAAHEAELARHVLAMEADFGDGRAYAMRSPGRGEAWDRIARLLAPLEVAWDEGEPHGGADVGPMHERGGVPLADIAQDGTRYFDIHHTANDVMTEIDRASLDHAMRAVLTVAYAASLDVDGLARSPAP
jgi:hypothetical protein